MSYEEVSGGAESLTTEEGTVVEGIYMNTITRPDKDDPDKLRSLHVIRVDGKIVNYYGTGHLDYLLRNVPKNSKVRISYMGKQKVKGYKVQLHQFKLEVDRDYREKDEKQKMVEEAFDDIDNENVPF